MTDVPADRRVRSLVWVLAGAGILLVLALLLAGAGSATDFAPFLAALLGGWGVGIAGVQAIALLRRGALLLHVLVAAAAIALAVVLARADAGAFGAVVAFAALPAAAWLTLALLGRLLSLVRTTGEERHAPAWEADDERDGALVRVRAVRLHLATLIVLLIAATTVAGAATIPLMIWLDRLDLLRGARVVILAVGLVVVLPVFLGFRALVRGRAAVHAIGFGRSELRIDGPGGTERFPYGDIDELRWREGTEYARLEVRSAGHRRTLLVGQARPAPGRTAELPSLSRRTVQQLEAAGLTPSRGGAVTIFRRRRP